jgi:hypothetical protein
VGMRLDCQLGDASPLLERTGKVARPNSRNIGVAGDCSENICENDPLRGSVVWC